MGSVYLGDAAEVLPALDVRPQLIVTSPPYDNLRTYGGHGFDFDRMADALVSSMPEGGVLVWVVADATIDGSETGTSFRQALGFMERGLKLHDTMIWEKVNPAPVVLPHRYVPAWDFMFVFAKERVEHSNLLTKPNVGAGQSRKYHSHRGGDRIGKFDDAPIKAEGTRHNIWAYKTGTNGKAYAPDYPEAFQHTSIFPYALARDHILTWSNPGDLVLDPMAGSGTTLRAAKDLGRQYVGVEIHEPYCELIRDRMAQSVLPIA